MFSNLPPVLIRFLDHIAELCNRTFLKMKRICLRYSRRTRRRNYYMDKRNPVKMVLRGALLLILASIFLICAGRLIAYVGEYASSRKSSAKLREAYYLQEESTPETAVPTVSATPYSPTPEPTSLPTATIANTATATPGTASVLPIVSYPYNPYGVISERFIRIRRQNSDIIGWLTIPDLLDEAVVQRDNQYYLKRDYQGYHNANGAIFLDEAISLAARPYTLILYGHNMKTGAMFGCLRNYENTTFYHSNPFISFDTIYEDGRYVIFSVATISVISNDWDHVSLNRLMSSFTAERQAEIKQLRFLSIYSSTIDVQADDQLLLLITCNGDDSERRIVAARRVREGEDEESLARQVRKSIKKQ